MIMIEKIKRESGVLSIEATLVVSFLAFVIMLIMNIGYVYQAQNRIYHGMIQTAKTIGTSSFEVSGVDTTATQDVLGQIELLFENLGWKRASQKDNFKRAIENKNAPQAVKIAFANSVSTGETEADITMKAYGVDGGLHGIDFGKSKFENGDIKVVAKYKINLILPVFGVDSVTLKQSTLAKMWGE